MEFIGKIFQDHKDLHDKLLEISEITFATIVNDDFKKILLLSVASYFERRIQDAIRKCIEKYSHNEPRVVEFVTCKGIDRQYHTYFDWDSSNANRFFKLFGNRLKQEAITDTNANEKLSQATKDFIELGRIRNEMVHGNFGQYVFEKTPSEVYQLYISAKFFVDYVESKLK